jgi:hypothetical protein
MPHIILDVNFPTHPKVVRVAPLAQLLHIRAMLYSCQHLTDGKLHRSIVGMLGYDLGDAQALAQELIEARLWHERGEEIEINDYLDFQYSRKEIEHMRAVKRRAGQRGGKAKSACSEGKQDASSVSSVCQDTASPTSVAEGKQTASTVLGVCQENGADIPKSSSSHISDVRSPISDVRSPMPYVQGKKKKTCSGDPAAPSKSDATYAAYAQAYQRRYRAVPVRNASVNAMLCRLVDKLGAEEAPQVAGFYLSHHDPFYVRRRHPVELLLKDAEGLRTQWATGCKATTREAQSAEQRDNVREQYKRVMADLVPESREVVHGKS